MNYIRLSDDGYDFVIRTDQLLGFSRGRGSLKTALRLTGLDARYQLLCNQTIEEIVGLIEQTQYQKVGV